MRKVSLLVVLVIISALNAFDVTSNGLDNSGNRSLPGPPTNFATEIVNDSIRLSWTEIPTADRYIVEGSISTKSGFIDISSTGVFSKQDQTVYWTSPSISRHRFYKVLSVKNSMVYVEGGTYNNGTSNVTVSSFYMDQYEVTQTGYQAVMGRNPSNYPNVVNGPVEMSSWFNAIEYCNRRSMNEGLNPCFSYGTYGTDPSLWPTGWNSVNANHVNVTCNWTANGYRLPTEAEWQFAARGGNNTHNYTYSGSNDVNAVAWWSSNSSSTTHAVGTKAANELGLYDMSGNVWEWCWDIYGTYPSGAQTNPKGATTGTYRVHRGGSWFCPLSSMPITFRYYHAPTFNFIYLGFRVCRNTIE